MKIDDYSWEEKKREAERIYEILRGAGLSARAAHGLAWVGYETREKILEAYKDKRLLKLRHIGVVSYHEIGRWLNKPEPKLCPYCRRPL
jgi:hypothetical protein